MGRLLRGGGAPTVDRRRFALWPKVFKSLPFQNPGGGGDSQKPLLTPLPIPLLIDCSMWKSHNAEQDFSGCHFGGHLCQLVTVVAFWVPPGFWAEAPEKAFPKPQTAATPRSKFSWQPKIQLFPKKNLVDIPKSQP